MRGREASGLLPLLGDQLDRIEAAWRALFARRFPAATPAATEAALAEIRPSAAFLHNPPGVETTAALATAAQHAKELGYLTSDDISGLVDLSLLDEVRAPPK